MIMKDKTKENNIVRAILTRTNENGETEVLLGQRGPTKYFAGFWEHPGGKQDEGESPTQALIREVREETNLEIKVDSTPFSIQFAYHDIFKTNYIVQYYSAQILNLDEFIHMEKDKTSKWEWFNENNIPDPEKMLHNQCQKSIILDNPDSPYVKFLPSL